MRRPCLTCGRPTDGSRCPAHRADYGTQWRKISTAAKEAQPWCSGPGPHSGRLEVDHVIPSSLEGGVQVLCVACHRKKTAAQRT